MATDLVLCSFCEILSGKWADVTDVGANIAIPVFEEDVMLELCCESAANLKTKPTLLHLCGEIIVVGDLHGSLHDLIRIFKEFGLPPARRYLFLGDYVDRGNFSIEVITILLALSNRFPEHIHLIRGNHEFCEIFSKYGFLEDISKVFQTMRLVAAFTNVFSELPLAAVINNMFFCCHGGLSEHLTTLKQIESLKRPIHSDRATAEAPFLKDLLWADPSDEFPMFAESRRGEMHTYGKQAVRKFLERNNLVAVIRAHEYCTEGIKSNCGRSVITVFSASCYKPDRENKCGVLLIDPAGLRGHKFDPIRRIQRDFCSFFTMKRPEKRSKPQTNLMACHSLRSFKNVPMSMSGLVMRPTVKQVPRLRAAMMVGQPMYKTESLPACSNTFKCGSPQ